MKAIALVLALTLAGCATQQGGPPTPNNLANIDSSTVATAGTIIGTLMDSNPLAAIAGGVFGKLVGDALAGYFKQPNTLQGTVWMPLEAQPVRMTLADPRAVACPPGYTCTPMQTPVR